MPPRKPRAAAAAPADVVTPDVGVATENVVRDPEEVPQPAAVDVAAPLAVENVVVDLGPVAQPDGTGGSGNGDPGNDDIGDSGQGTP